MNLKLSQITAPLKLIKRYYVVVFFISCLSIFGFIVMRISTLNNPPVSEELLSEQQSTKIPHIDQDVLDKIKTLETENIQVRSLFEEARNNPFKE